jgi:hypothetical protein
MPAPQIHQQPVDDQDNQGHPEYPDGEDLESFTSFIEAPERDTRRAQARSDADRVDYEPEEGPAVWLLVLSASVRHELGKDRDARYGDDGRIEVVGPRLGGQP